MPYEPDSRPRAARHRRDREETWSPPRRSKSGVPGWVWAVAGSCLAVVVVVALGLGLQRRHRDEPQNQPDAEQLADPGDGSERWVRKTHEASGAAWESPTTGESFPTSTIVRVADQKAITFAAIIKDVPAREKSSPSLHPLAKLRSARPGEASPFGKVDSTRTIDGRPAVVIRTQHYTSLIAADYDRTYEFTVTPPDPDEGSRRTKRFFESVRITRPMPPEPAPPSTGGPTVASGEAIPPGWDRIQVPRTQLTLLMPKGLPSSPGKMHGFPGSFPVYRALTTPDGDEITVYAIYIEATAVASGIGDPFGGVKERRTSTVGGYQAFQEYRVLFGMHTVTEMIYLDSSMTKFFIISVGGEAVDFNSPEVKRVFDSVSFTLPAKNGPEAPEDLTPPPWTRRFASTPALTGVPFSVEMPGRSRGGMALSLGAAMTWGSKGQIPLPGRKKMEFAAIGLGIAVPGGPDPRKMIEMEIQSLGGRGSAMQFVRRVEVGGRPGYVSARTDKNGYGHVEMKVQDVVMGYTLAVAGPGVTVDTPEVKRFFESASFAIAPDPAAPEPPKK